MTDEITAEQRMADRALCEETIRYAAKAVDCESHIEGNWAERLLPYIEALDRAEAQLAEARGERDGHRDNVNRLAAQLKVEQSTLRTIAQVLGVENPEDMDNPEQVLGQAVIVQGMKQNFMQQRDDLRAQLAEAQAERRLLAEFIEMFGGSGHPDLWESIAAMWRQVHESAQALKVENRDLRAQLAALREPVKESQLHVDLLYSDLAAAVARAEKAETQLGELRNELAPDVCGGTDFWDAHSPKEIARESRRRDDETIQAIVATKNDQLHRTESATADAEGRLRDCLNGKVAMNATDEQRKAYSPCGENDVVVRLRAALTLLKHIPMDSPQNHQEFMRKWVAIVHNPANAALLTKEPG